MSSEYERRVPRAEREARDRKRVRVRVHQREVSTPGVRRGRGGGAGVTDESTDSPVQCPVWKEK